jgi:hypothetical protein
MLEIRDNTPFLVNFAVPRTSGPSIGGHYCEELDMWVDEKTSKPVIEMSNTAELVTKTKAETESDDEANFALELVTKTFVSPESDDDGLITKSCLPELVTKTDVQMESDDNGFEL